MHKNAVRLRHEKCRLLQHHSLQTIRLDLLSARHLCSLPLRILKQRWNRLIITQRAK